MMPLPAATSNPRTTGPRRLDGILGMLLLIVASPLIVAAIALHLLAGLCLNVAAWCCWCARGRYVLFVYSNSPIWQAYVEEHVLPRLGDRAVVLNWSERSRWRHTLPVLAFRYFGGSREFNPMAVVFRPFRFAHRVRFYEPFREFKHGKHETVTTLTEELFALLDGHGRETD